MKTVEMTQATGELPSYADQVRLEPVVVTDRGKPVMALMSIENADLETVNLSTDPRFIALIERSRALYKPGTGIPLEEIKRKYAIKSKPKPARRSHKARWAGGRAAMNTIDVADATDTLSDYAKKGLKEALVVTRRGKPLLAVTPIRQDDWESIAIANNPKFLAIIERSRKSQKPRVSTEEMRRRLRLKRRAG